MYEPEEFRRTLAATLRAERHRRGITQESVIRRTGISKSSVIRIEQGSRPPTTDEFVAIAAALGVRAAWLMMETERQLDVETAPPPENLNDDDIDDDWPVAL